MVDFAVRGGFRSGWAFSQPILQLRNEGGGLRNGTRVLKGCFAAAKIFAEGVHGATKSFRSQEAISHGPLLGCEIS